MIFCKVLCNNVKVICLTSYTDNIIIFRLVSCYEDKALGLSENGEIFGFLANKSFPQFIDFVCHHGNEHWDPFYRHCNFCEINYDMIGRMENFNDDLMYIAQKNNFAYLLSNENYKYHLHRSGRPTSSAPDKVISNPNYAGKVKQYFSQLSDIQLEKLFVMYKLDFEIFQYDKYKYV